MKCTKSQAKSIYLLRFSAAGAAIQYAAVNHKEVESIVALDIPLKRNEKKSVKDIPKEISSKLVKKSLLALLKTRGAEYPAEHNVGHHFEGT